MRVSSRRTHLLNIIEHRHVLLSKPRKTSSINFISHHLRDRKMRVAATIEVAAGGIRQDLERYRIDLQDRTAPKFWGLHTPRRALKNSRCWNLGAWKIWKCVIMCHCIELCHHWLTQLHPASIPHFIQPGTPSSPLPCAGKSLAQSPEHCQAVPSKCQYVNYLDAMDSTWFKDIPCDVSDPTHVNAVFHDWKRTCLLQLCLKLFIQQFWKVGTP